MFYNLIMAYQQRNISYMRLCCAEGKCFKNFKDLPERLGELQGVTVLDGYMHETHDG